LALWSEESSFYGLPMHLSRDGAAAGDKGIPPDLLPLADKRVVRRCEGTGIKLCQGCPRQHGFHAIYAMPTNLFRTGDKFDLNSTNALRP